MSRRVLYMGVYGTRSTPRRIGPGKAQNFFLQSDSKLALDHFSWSGYHKCSRKNSKIILSTYFGLSTHFVPLCAVSLTLRITGTKHRFVSRKNRDFPVFNKKTALSQSCLSSHSRFQAGPMKFLGNSRWYLRESRQSLGTR